MGITPTGRGTCDRLDLNDLYHNEGAIIRARRLWIRAGWHPPSNDPRLLKRRRLRQQPRKQLSKIS
jgi:hypothetical protein